MSSISHDFSDKARPPGSWLWLAAAVALLAAALAGACSESNDTDLGGGSGGTTVSSGGAGGLDFDGGTGLSGGGLDQDSACATASDEARLVPVNMYIMFDKSGSMLGDKWAQTTAALQAFFSDPESAGLRVALSFFPDSASGCDQDCDINACSQPKVPLGELLAEYAPDDAQEEALSSSFASVTPGGTTPLSAALEGALQWGEDLLAAAPLDKAVVVLVTDGQPTECELNANYIINTTSIAYINHGIITFAIGLFDDVSQALLNGIAQAGGTQQGIFVGLTNAEQELLDALNEIRASTVACEYLMPESTGPEPIDPGKVNVIYHPGGGEPITIGQVPDAAACAASGGGWYYDNPASPTKIAFCELTCDLVRADPDAQIEILLGCSTIPA